MGTVEFLLVVGVVLVLVVLVGLRRGSPDTRPTFTHALTVPVPAELQSRVRELSARGQKIQAVKELREALQLSLVDAKNIADAIAAGNALPTPGGPARPPAAGGPAAWPASGGPAAWPAPGGPAAGGPTAWPAAGGPGAPRGDLAYRVRALVAAGQEPQAVRLVAEETGISAPEARAFVTALHP